MSDAPAILLTNDDGIDSVGFRALYDSLSAFADVTAVAPADDRSAVGRALSSRVDVVEHELGYAIDGTPADCTVAGLEALCPDVDLVVAGCNRGANLGAYVLGRSGTVSAAVEAAFFDVPAIATSLYLPPSRTEEVGHEAAHYRDAVRATAYLVKHAFGAGVFEEAEYLNVNAPTATDDDAPPADMEVTRPSTLYEMTAIRDEDARTIRLTDRIWDRMERGDLPESSGTDRRAVVEGRVSVSPLTAPHTVRRHDALDALAETYVD